MPVTIQDGWAPGSRQIISFPGGQRVAIVVPPGCVPGQVIQVQAPAPPPQTGTRLQIMVPAGCAPGSRVEFKLPDGRSMNANVPAGMRPGQQFTVEVPPAPGSAPAPAPIPVPPPGAPEPAPAPQIAPPPVGGGDEDRAGEGGGGGSSSSTPAPSISLRHSEAEVASAEAAVLREGYLQKQGHIRKSWKKRWFVLKSDGQMPYYKNENSASRDEEPLGIIQIGTDGLSVAGGEAEAEAASRAHAFRLYQPGSRGVERGREFILAGSDQSDTEAWINTIERRYQLQREIELGLDPGRGSGGFTAQPSPAQPVTHRAQLRQVSIVHRSPEYHSHARSLLCSPLLRWLVPPVLALPSAELAAVVVGAGGGGGGGGGGASAGLAEALLVDADGEVGGAGGGPVDIDVMIKPHGMQMAVKTTMTVGKLKVRQLEKRQQEKHKHRHSSLPRAVL